MPFSYEFYFILYNKKGMSIVSKALLKLKILIIFYLLIILDFDNQYHIIYNCHVNVPSTFIC